MERFHLVALAVCLVVTCGGLNVSFAQEPKTILSDDFLTRPGDDLPALKEYIARLVDYNPRTMEEYEKWVRGARESHYSALLEASDKLLGIATEPADIVLAQKGKLIALENLSAYDDNGFDEFAPQFRAFAGELIRETPDSENAIYAQAVLLEFRYCELHRMQIHTEKIKTKEDFLQQLQEINDAWIVQEKPMRDFIEKHPGVKTLDLLHSMLSSICFYEVKTDQEKIAAFKKYLEQSDMGEAKRLLQRFDSFVEGQLSFKAITKLRHLHLLAGDNEQEIDEVRQEFRRYFDSQREAILDPKNQFVRKSYVDCLNVALELFGGEEWILGYFQVLKDFYLASDDPRFQRSAEVLDGIMRRGQLKGNTMEFEAFQLDGTKIDIRDFRGKVVLIDFWVTWCGPCIASFPKVEEYHAQYRDQGFVVIAYSHDENLDALRDYEAKHAHPWISTSRQLTLDKGGKNYSDYYGISGIPSYILVGRDGKVVAPATHPAVPEFSEMLEKALQER